MSVLNISLFYFFRQFAGVSPALDSIIVFFASYLTYILVAALVLGVFFWSAVRHHKVRAVGTALLAAFASRGIAVESIRFFYHHPRPPAMLPDIRPLITETSYSFPSGHAAFFFSLSAVVYSYDKRWGVVFFIASALMGLARIAAGVHFPADIAAGALIGTVVGLGTFALVKRCFPPKGENGV